MSSTSTAQSQVREGGRLVLLDAAEQLLDDAFVLAAHLSACVPHQLRSCEPLHQPPPLVFAPVSLQRARGDVLLLPFMCCRNDCCAGFARVRLRELALITRGNSSSLWLTTAFATYRLHLPPCLLFSVSSPFLK